MDFRQVEEKWQKRWEESRIWEVEPKKQKKFYLTVAYPYPSGSMHVGHVRTYLIPDVIARFKRAQGFNVLFPMAWHVTGTPIVGAVNRLKAGEEKQLKVLKEVFKIPEEDLKKMQTPMDYARYFIERDYIPNMRRLGLSIDWRRQFTTADPKYNSFIRWQHKKLFSAGLEHEGEHPVKFCLRERNPVTTHDLLEGEEAEMHELVLLKFRFGDRWLVAATLRPETVYGQTNLWVNPEISYVEIEVDGERWICSRECAEKLGVQGKHVEIKGEINGRDLLGKTCLAPGIEREIPILPADFCDPDFGSGLVTSVPSDAPWDWIALQELKRTEWKEIAEKLEPIEIIETPKYGRLAAKKVCEELGITSVKQKEKLEEATQKVYKEGFHKGKMLVGPYQGMPVQRAKELVKEELIKQGKADVMWDFSEPVRCRCGSKVVVAISRSWFIDYSKEGWKERVREALKEMRIIPEHTLADYLHAVDWLKEWPCVRNYGLGTKLPQDERFIIEPLSDSTIYMAFYTVSHLVEKPLPEEAWEWIFLGKGDPEKAGLEKKELERLRKSFLYWYPLDWRTSAADLIQNHLTFMLFHHTAIFPKELWPKGIVTFGMGLLESEKMSSSKGRVILASEALQRYGADPIRLFLLLAAEPWQDFDWKEKEVGLYREKLEKWAEWFRQRWEEVKGGGKGRIDLWLKSKVSQIVKEVTESLESWQIRKAGLKAFFEFWDALRWYCRRTEAGEALREAMETWLKLLAPWIPHLTQELWEWIGKQGFIHEAGWPEAGKTDPKLEMGEELIRRTMEDIREIIKLKGQPKSIRIYTAPEWKHEVYQLVLEALERKAVLRDILTDPRVQKHGKRILEWVQRLFKEGKLAEVLTAQEEYEVLKEAEAFFKKEFGCKVEVIEAIKAEGEKAARAEPGKPGIELCF